MRIWNLDQDSSNNFISVSDGNPYQINVFIPGPPGVAGPIGPQGPPGTNAGNYLIMTVSGNIVLGQIFTLSNGASLSLTLPLISTVISGALTQLYFVRNISSSNVTLHGSASDQVEFSSTATLFPNDSFGLLATPLGWVIL